MRVGPGLDDAATGESSVAAEHLDVLDQRVPVAATGTPAGPLRM
jgi:hypothetical protein